MLKEKAIKDSIESFYQTTVNNIQLEQLSRHVFTCQAWFKNGSEIKLLLKKGDKFLIKHCINSLNYCFFKALNTPRVIYFNESFEWVLMEIIDGEKTFVKSPQKILENHHTIINTIADLHFSLLNNDEKSIEFQNDLYVKLLSKHNLSEIWDQFKVQYSIKINEHNGLKSISRHTREFILQTYSSLIEDIKNNIKTVTTKINVPAFIHGDLHLGNIIERNKQYYIIDFEYCHASKIVQNDLVKLLEWPKLEITYEQKHFFVDKYILEAENRGFYVNDKNHFKLVFDLLTWFHKFSFELSFSNNPNEAILNLCEAVGNKM